MNGNVIGLRVKLDTSPRREDSMSRIVFFILLLMLALISSILAEDEPIRITLMNKGREPRKVLRLSPPDLTVQLSGFRREKTVWMEYDDSTSPLPDAERKQVLTEPTVMTLSELKVGGERKGDKFFCASTLRDFVVEEAVGRRAFLIRGGTDEPTEPKIRECLESRRGAQRMIAWQPMGNIEDAGTYDPADVCTSLGAEGEPLSETIRVLFPEEEVGIGAKWKVERPIALTTDYAIPVVMECELKSLQGTRADVEFSMSGELKVADAKLPGFPEDANVAIERMKLSGKGRSEMDLTLIDPLRATVKLEISAVMVIKRLNNVTTITNDATMSYTIIRVAEEKEWREQFLRIASGGELAAEKSAASK